MDDIRQTVDRGCKSLDFVIRYNSEKQRGSGAKIMYTTKLPLNRKSEMREDT